MGCVPYGSPTLSNNALLAGVPTLKMGPGDTTRSHTANEYVLISEIRDGIEKFTAMLDGLKL
jgi:acetylornithine deacetylase